MTQSLLLGSLFGRTDFSRIFIFGPLEFFADFVAGFFFLILVGKSAQKNPPGKSPAKSSNIYTTKSPTHFCRRARPTFKEKMGDPPLFSRIAFKKRGIVGHLYKKRRIPHFCPLFFLGDDFPSLTKKGDESFIEWTKKKQDGLGGFKKALL